MDGVDPMARPLWDFLIPAVVLGLLTLLFVFFPLDLFIQGWFYQAKLGGWFMKDAEPLAFVYDKGLIPALCVAIGSIVLLAVGFKVGSMRKYRKVAIYLLAVMVVAPGLLVNAVMKEGWGRPRPRQVEQFGGPEVHERVWEYDASSYGKSFPSGHAAMGFYFFCLYFLMRREGRKAALFWLLLAIGLGGILGVTRMIQGGHFPSDVLWSAGVCYFVSAGFYYGMGLHRSLWYRGGSLSRGTVLGCVVAVLGVGLLMVGTPYHEEKNFEVPVSELEARVLDLKLELPKANLQFGWDTEFSMKSEAEGFGSPGSRLEDRFKSSRDGETCSVRLRQKKSGFLATLEQPMEVAIPGRELNAEVVLEKGKLRLEISPDAKGDIDLDLGDVDLTFLVPDGVQLKIELGDAVEEPALDDRAGLDWDGEKRRWKRGEQPALKVKVKACRGEKIAIVPRR